MNQSAIIIGGGIGGLFTGAFLAKNGLKVTVLEKNDIIGGGLQCFRRKDKIFETGMHVMGGFEKGGSLYKICKYLGILDTLKIQHINRACMDEIVYHKSHETFRIPSGKEEFIEGMSNYFPSEREGIRKYVDEIYRLAEEEPLFCLKEAPDTITVHSDKFTWSADRLIDEYVKDSKLRELLAYLNPLYGGVAGHTPAYVHALINVLYINGSSRFIGGSQQLADALKLVITDHGGAVLAGQEVAAIDVIEKKISKIRTKTGDEYEGDWYISSIHPVALLELLPERTFLRGFINRLNEIPVSYSAFSLFVDLKPGMLPYIDHTCYYMEDFGSMWTQAQYDHNDWPNGFMYMTPPDANQGDYANRLLVHCIMSYDQVKRWENTTVGKRGELYNQWKKEHTDKVLRKMENIFPGIAGMIANVYAASPLTIRDYYKTKEGAIFGYRKDCENLLFSKLSVYTKVKNLLMTGQNINLHGICGVPLTAINTSEAILGANYLVNAINKANE